MAYNAMNIENPSFIQNKAENGAESEKRKRIVLVDLQYPYEKKKVYMSGALSSVGARLLAMGHGVNIVDFNIDNYTDQSVQDSFRDSNLIGITVIGSPLLPSAVELVHRVRKDHPHAEIMLGGLMIEKLSSDGFRTIFGDQANVHQITDDSALTQLLDEETDYPIPGSLNIPYVPVWEQMGDDRLKTYLQTEMTLVVSQGCAYNCHFCAARKDQLEQHKTRESFEADVRFLAEKARQFGINHLEFYASSLDFFQHPRIIARHLAILAKIREETSVDIKVRCLSCMNSFLHAEKTINDRIQKRADGLEHFDNFRDLVNRSGLWCVGFGFESTDEKILHTQNKDHNKIDDIERCIDLCQKCGLRCELLFVFGFPEANWSSMWKTARDAVRYTLNHDHVVLRPYLAKPFLPGNEGWTDEVDKMMAKDVNQFYNLDVCAIASPLTDPKLFHRWMSNFLYLSMIAFLAPTGKCATGPLLPQGQGGIYGKVAKMLNRYMPTER